MTLYAGPAISNIVHAPVTHNPIGPAKIDKSLLPSMFVVTIIPPRDITCPIIESKITIANPLYKIKLLLKAN